MVVGLVGCSARKLDRAAPARELYQGRLFDLSAEYAERRCARWFVLSAKYGLVGPDERLRPYDVTLHDMGVMARMRWAGHVYEGLRVRGLDRQDVSWLVLAGRYYREFLVDALAGEAIVPLAGLRIGEQIRWLKVALEGGLECG